jgi:hypothetical protein
MVLLMEEQLEDILIILIRGLIVSLFVVSSFSFMVASCCLEKL